MRSLVVLSVLSLAFTAGLANAQWGTQVTVRYGQSAACAPSQSTTVQILPRAYAPTYAPALPPVEIAQTRVYYLPTAPAPVYAPAPVVYYPAAVAIPPKRFPTPIRDFFFGR